MVNGNTISVDVNTIDSIAAMLLEVREIASDTNKKVTSNADSSKSYADVVKKVDELKEIAAITNAKVNENCFNKQVMPVPTDRNLVSYPRLGTPSLKRKCTASPPSAPMPPPRKFFSRKLTSGTATVANHGLGSRVILSDGNMSQSTRAQLTKAIYVSRMQNDVTKEKIVEYVKSQMAD